MEWMEWGQEEEEELIRRRHSGGAGATFDTHSTVWLVHGEVAHVLPGRHTEDNGENKKNYFLEDILHLFWGEITPAILQLLAVIERNESKCGG